MGGPGGQGHMTEEEKKKARERRQEEQKRRQEMQKTRIGKKKVKKSSENTYSKLPAVNPISKCRLRLLRQERIKDYLLMEEEFIKNQEVLKPQEETIQKEKQKVDRFRESPMDVGTLEEIIDDDHAIVSPHAGLEYYVPMYSFVDKELLEPGCSVLLNHKSHAIIGVLTDEVDPMVSVMKVEKAPQESYADIGGLDS